MNLDAVKSLIKDVADFPKPGIIFKDITPIFENPEAFQFLAKYMADRLAPETNKIVAIESRGFLFAMAMAQYTQIPVVLARKPGKLPRETVYEEYTLEYGTDRLEIHKDSLTREDKITIVDDIIATGGTAKAVESLCTKQGATVVEHMFFMELSFLSGKDALKSPIQAIYSI